MSKVEREGEEKFAQRVSTSRCKEETLLSKIDLVVKKKFFTVPDRSLVVRKLFYTLEFLRLRSKIIFEETNIQEFAENFYKFQCENRSVQSERFFAERLQNEVDTFTRKNISQFLIVINFNGHVLLRKFPLFKLELEANWRP